MKKWLFGLAAILAAASSEAKTVATYYYMGDAYGSTGYGYVTPLNAVVGAEPVTFTVVDMPAGWKVSDWLTARDGNDIQHLDKCISHQVSTATYTWTDYASETNALAVRFDPVSYTLSFDTAGGDAIPVSGPYLSTNLVRLAEYTGTKDGHSFAGWTNGYVKTALSHATPFTGVDKLGLGNVDTNITLYASWTAKVYTVTFKYRNSAGEWAELLQSVEYRKSAVPPADDVVDTCPGYVFSSWSKSYSSVTEDITVTAQYTRSSYTVQFDPNAENVSGAMGTQLFTYDVPQFLLQNAFSCPGHAFVGWNTEPDGSGDGYGDKEQVSNLTGKDGATVTLYAQWSTTAYTIAFDGNGGSGSMKSMSVAYGDSVTLPANAFKKVGWSFKGWSYGGKVIADKAIVKNLTSTDGATVTLVAIWGDYQSEFQRAIHCDNLEWNGIAAEGLNGTGEWKIGKEGYEGSGSCAEQTEVASNALTAVVATNGTLSFYCRKVSSESATLYLTINQYKTKFSWKAVTKIYNPGDDWESNSIDIAFSEIIPPEDPPTDYLYIHLAVLYGTVQIDQMKWEPEGGSGGGGGGGDDPATAIDLSLTGYTGKYDGAGHGIKVDVAKGISGLAFMYATGATLPDSGWTNEAPVLVDAGTTRVWCAASAPGYAPETNSATVAISSREITLTSGSASKVYDGKELSNQEVVVGGDGFVGGDGLTCNVTGAQTEAGTSENTFSYEFYEGTKAANYSVSEVFGTLTVTKAAYDMSGVAWDYSAPFEYDGRRKSVSLVGLPDGVSASYSGNAATRPGKYEAAATFASESPNYETPMEMFCEWEIVASGGGVFPGEGTVTPPKSVVAGKDATWKATAAKGSVFANWEGDAVDALSLSRNEVRNPSLKFVVPEGLDPSKIGAVFVAIDNDGLGMLSLSSDEPLDLGVEVSGLEVLDDSESYVTASVSGLPSGLKFDKKTMKITGAPKKSGAFILKITAKNASGYQWAENVALLVKDASGAVPRKPLVPEPKRTAYYPLTTVSSDLSAGTVSGTGVYAEGKKASISAKPAKGWAFAGWYCDAALTTPMEFESGDYRKASQKVLVPEARYLYARFVKATVKDDPISGLAAKGSGLVAENSFRWCVGVAVPEGDGVEYESASLPSASSAKLPPGVKFDAAKGRFTGVPTKAGKYSATVAVKNASKAAATLALTVEVAELDAWAQGTFSGEVGNGESASAEATADKLGTVSMTVSSAGKISGKILEGGKTWTLSAASFSRVEPGAAYFATVVGKAGKEVMTNEVAFTASDGVGVATSQPFNLSTFQPFNFSWTAWQNLWKRADTKASQPVFKKSVDLALESGVNLTFKKDGAVAFSGTVGGTKVSGSSQLVLAESGWQVTLYAPLKGASGVYCETVAVALKTGEGNVVTEVLPANDD